MPGNIWNKPATPHVLDDEFESTTLDPSWDVGTVDLVTPIDPYVSGVTPPRIQIHTDLRPSWFTCQGAVLMSKLYPGGVLPTNVLIWARIAPWTTTATRVNNDSMCGIWFADSTAGALGSDSIRLYLRSNTGADDVDVRKAELGGFPSGSSIATSSSRGLSYEYIGIHKIGTDFHCWAMTSGGIRMYMGSVEYLGTGTLDRVCIYMSGSETVPGTPITAFDFFRVVESATYLP